MLVFGGATFYTGPMRLITRVFAQFNYGDRFSAASGLMLATILLAGCDLAGWNGTMTATSPPLPTALPLSTRAAMPSETIPPLSPTATYDAGPARALLDTGNRSLASKNFNRAVEDYSLAVRADSGFGEAFCRRGLAYIGLGDYQAAFSDFTQGLGLAPYQVECYIGRAQVYFRDRRNMEALADLAFAAQLDPLNPEIYLVRGQVYFVMDSPQKNYTRALLELDRVVALAPERADGHVERARVYQAAGLDPDALADLNIALSLDPTLAEAYSMQGQIYQRNDLPREAIAGYERALALGYETTDQYVNLGMSYLKLEDAAAAISMFDRAVNREPDNTTALYGRGAAYLLDNRGYAALADANKIIQLQPDNVEALGLRGSIYLNLKRWDDAITDFERAYRLNPDYVEALYGIGLANIALGKTSEAEAALAEYVKRVPASSRNLSVARSLLDGLRALTPTPGSP